MKKALNILAEEKIKDLQEDILNLRTVMKFKDYSGIHKELLNVEKNLIKKLKSKISILERFINE